MREPHGGSVLDDVEIAWVTANKGSHHIRTCETCNKPYYSLRLQSLACWGCWYNKEMELTTQRFVPLSTKLERRLEVKTSVAQTGGMVMCLKVPIGREVDNYGNIRHYAYFSELTEGIGLGLYEHDEEGEPLNDGIYHEWPGEFFCGSSPCSWYHHPDIAEAVAEWAAPLVVAFAVERLGQ